MGVAEVAVTKARTASAPVGADTLTLTVTLGWQDGMQGTFSATTSWTIQCGAAKPWAKLTNVCNDSIRAELGNGGDALGAVRLKLKIRYITSGTIFATDLFLPGQQTSVIVPHAWSGGPIEVILAGDNDPNNAPMVNINNWGPIPQDCPPGEIIANPPLAGSAGGPGASGAAIRDYVVRVQIRLGTAIECEPVPTWKLPSLMPPRYIYAYCPLTYPGPVSSVEIWAS